MNRYLLDTNICIYYIKGLYELAEKIRSVGLENCYVSELTVAELLYGVEKSSSNNKDRNTQKLKDFKSSIKIVPLSNCMELFAKEKARLEKAGTRLDVIDLLIGCSAIANQMILVTRNVKHFERIQGIQIENWID
ncbi:MAG: type II toxin-antitoxin system VapC family toxin [Leptospiraceae bacterium]|nr:type II toxin-antitoxin system VapC family toxin [Leptospiraceae bacterium]MCP5501074.1 type II toxin-antitoxin system VapC family toxin [Leptospiraceae bacterium]